MLSCRCRFAPSGALRVKGKQVQGLCDLVTVCGLLRHVETRPLRNREGGGASCREPGNLPSAGAEKKFPGSRGLDHAVFRPDPRRARPPSRRSRIIILFTFR